jgi:hypothetical protein
LKREYRDQSGSRLDVITGCGSSHDDRSAFVGAELCSAQRRRCGDALGPSKLGPYEGSADRSLTPSSRELLYH